MDNKKKLLIGAVALVIFAALALDLGQYLNLEALQRERQALVDFRNTHPWSASALYFMLYVVVVGISLPGGVNTFTKPLASSSTIARSSSPRSKRVTS